MKLHQHWAKDFNICHSFIQQIFINTKCQESQRHEPCSKTPYSQERQGLDTCYLTTVKIQATKNTVCVRAGRQAGEGEQRFEERIGGRGETEFQMLSHLIPTTGG